MHGDPNLNSERGHTETIGLEHNFDDNTNIAVNYFHSSLQDGIDWVSPPNPSYVRVGSSGPIGERVSTNSYEGKEHGFEISFKQRVNDNFSYDVGYSRISSIHRIKAYSASEGWYIWDFNTNSRPNGWRVGLHFKDGRWKANLMGIIFSGISTYDSSYHYNMPTSHTLAVFDFNVSYDPTDWATIYVRATNFTNQDQIRHASGYGQHGRFYQAGVTCRF